MMPVNDKYLKEYNFKVLPGSGPYTIREEDISKGKSISVRRRKDYWAEKARVNVGVPFSLPAPRMSTSPGKPM